MDFRFIEELRLLLENSNLFGYKFLMTGAKALAMALLIFRLLETYIQNIDNETSKVGNFMNLFGYACFIMSSDWIINIIESSLSVIDLGSIEDQSYTYEALGKAATERMNTLLEDLEYFSIFDFALDVLIGLFYTFIVGLLATVCKIADLAMTVSYLLSRMFLIELSKVLFPIIIALSTIKQTQDLLGRWIKRYIGLYLLGIAYLGIISFSALVQTSLLKVFETNSAGEVMGIGHYMFGMCITIIVVFSFKVKMFATSTSYISNLFS